MNWDTEITPREGHTLYQWMVDESIRCGRWAEFYWESLDEIHEQPETQQIMDNYNQACDWLDKISVDPQSAYDSAP